MIAALVVGAAVFYCQNCRAIQAEGIARDGKIVYNVRNSIKGGLMT